MNIWNRFCSICTKENIQMSDEKSNEYVYIKRQDSLMLICTSSERSIKLKSLTVTSLFSSLLGSRERSNPCVIFTFPTFEPVVQKQSIPGDESPSDGQSTINSQ